MRFVGELVQPPTAKSTSCGSLGRVKMGNAALIESEIFSSLIFARLSALSCLNLAQLKTSILKPSQKLFVYL